MRCHDERRARAVDAVEHADDLLGVLGVEVAGRFVREQDGGLLDDGARDGDALLLTAGEFVREAARLLGEADEFERLGHGRAHRAPTPAEDLEDERDVLGDRLVLEQPEILEDDADVAAQRRHLAARHRHEVSPGDVDLAGRRRHLVRHETHERALARAGLADEEDELSALDVEADVVERRRQLSAVRQTHMVETNHGFPAVLDACSLPTPRASRCHSASRAAARFQRMPASMNPSMSPSNTPEVLPTSYSVRRSLTIW